LCLFALGTFTTGFSQGAWCVQWLIFGWGIGLLANGFSVFGLSLFLCEDWERRKIDEIMNKNEYKQ
jgi:hypothetical protein